MNQKWQKTWVLGAVCLGALAAGCGGTFALWKGSEAVPAASITAGDLDIAAEAVDWVETSPDIESAPHPINANTFLVRQGDTFDVNYRFQTRIQGENMLAGLSIGWPQAGTAGALSLPAGVTGSYQVFAVAGADDRTEIVAVTPVGQDPDIDLEAMATDSTGSTENFELVVSLDFAGLTDRFGADSAPQITDLGAFMITLDQLRVGEGFN